MQLYFSTLRPVTRGPGVVPESRQASLLTYGSPCEAAFPISQWHSDFALPAYSDEFVQDFHLFPFSQYRRCGAKPVAAVVTLRLILYHIHLTNATSFTAKRQERLITYL